MREKNDERGGKRREREKIKKRTFPAVKIFYFLNKLNDAAGQSISA